MISAYSYYYKNCKKKKQFLFSPCKFYFCPAYEICGKYMQLLPRFSGAKGGHFVRVWNKINYYEKIYYFLRNYDLAGKT